MSNETESTPKDIDEPIVIPEGEPPDSDATRTATYSVAERKEYEKTETGQAEIAQLKAETAKIEAEAAKIDAETAKIKAETEETHAQAALLGIQHELAKDERLQRWIAAGLSFAGPGGCATLSFDVRCQTRRTPTRRTRKCKSL